MGSDVARLHLYIAHVVKKCRDVIRDVLEASVASAHSLDNELSCLHRDIHMIAADTIFDLDAAGEHYGHELLKDETPLASEARTRILSGAPGGSGCLRALQDAPPLPLAEVAAVEALEHASLGFAAQ